jgi:rhamnosyltransferase
MKERTVSIIIPTKNAGYYLDEQLSAIFNQEDIPRPEVILMDSGSKDATLRIAERYPVKVISIKPEEFDHGGTRNRGATASGGDYIVFLTQDATPADRMWLVNMLKPFREDPDVAGTFSRHIPRPGCSVPLARQIEEEWPQAGGVKRIVKEVRSREELEARRAFYVYFANTSSCLLRSVWQKIPFRDVEFGEDADWAERVLLSGYKIVYEPSSSVFHSHDYSLREQLRQHFDYGRFVRRSNLAASITVRQSAASFLASLKMDLEYIRRKRRPLSKFFYCVPFHAACVSGRWLGEHSGKIPGSLRGVISRQERIKGR